MIEHTGSACPVPSGTIVRVDLGDGEVYAGPADEWHWGPGLGYDGKGRTFACFMSGGCWAYWRIKGRDVCVVCRKPRRDR